MVTSGSWASSTARDLEARVRAELDGVAPGALADEVERLADENQRIHHDDCINLNPATNVMPPRAEALLAAGLSSRPSLGHPGDKYEMGLEAIERIELIAAELARRVFGGQFVEVRVGSGAMANLYTFLATCSPGDRIVAPPASIAGHVTHHRAGAAGLVGLEVVDAPIDRDRYTVDVDALAAVCREAQPRLVTIGGSLNLTHHPVAAIREIADEVGAKVLFDAAHLSGLIAGGVWPDPLDEGAHVLTMSTYKSLAGPAAGLLLTDDEELAERIDAIAYPGLTANFDVGATAALAVTLAGWLEDGAAYASAMVETADALAHACIDAGLPVVTTPEGPTRSHAFAIDASTLGGGHAAAQRLRKANLLTSAIGLPSGDGLRVGTTETARHGMGDDAMREVAELLAMALRADPEAVAPRVASLRRRFAELRYLGG